MSSSGLIYAAIALMWGAVLIPMWLRGHDTSVENRSAERFGQAMRVLSRRPGATDLEPDREVAHRAPVAAPPSSATRSPKPRQLPPVQRSTGQRPSLARRRARTLAVLGALTVLLGLLAVVNVVPGWAPVPATALLTAFVVHLRHQAKHAEAVRKRRAKRAAAGEPASDDQAEPRPSRALVVETKGDGSSAADSEAAEEPMDEEWRPNPLPLPTYVTAPKAVRPIRVIDLTTPGAWTSGRLLDDESVPDEDVLAAEMAADELDALLEHEAKGRDAAADDAARRAVGD